jgi:hypothetical protein
MSYIFGYNYLFEEHTLGENYKKWEYLYSCDIRINYYNTIYYLDMYNRLYKYKDGDKSNPTDCYLELINDESIRNNILASANNKDQNLYIKKIKSV